ncbi:MAG: hypothetical protein ACE5DY_06380 [Mariprofundaceae bacterium]
MRLSCPECRSVYELDSVDKDVILVCHRCMTEFEMGLQDDYTQESDDPALASSTPLAEEIPEQMEKLTSDDIDLGTEIECSIGDPENLPNGEPYGDYVENEDAFEASANSTPVASTQAHKPAYISVLLFTFLVFIAGSGLWLSHDTWLEKPWVRSFLINIGIKAQTHGHDWRIMDNKVQARWVERDNHSPILLIEGRVENLLQSKLPPPSIRISIYPDETNGKALKEVDMPITLQPLGDAIRRTPYVSPPDDTMPVLSRGTRGFILVLEDISPEASTFTLTAVAKSF